MVISVSKDRPDGETGGVGREERPHEGSDVLHMGCTVEEIT